MPEGPSEQPTQAIVGWTGGESKPAADDQATEVLPPTGEQPTAEGEPTKDQPTVVGTDQTQAVPQPTPMRDLPAGVDPGELAAAPIASARRGKLRRRLRYLRAVRDLLLRDLGGFLYEVQRTAGGTTQDVHRRLIETKTNRIATLDTEVRGLETQLGEPHGAALLREPGIGGTCPECGELHASDAHYCSRCGAPLDAKARARRDAAVAAAVQQTTGSHTTAEPAPASVLWAAGPRPEAATEPEEEDPHPSAVTSQWLALRPHAEAPEAEAAPTGEAPAAVEPVAEAAPAVDAPSEPAAEPAAEAAPAKPKRPRTTRAKKPAAETGGEPAAETGGEPAAETGGETAGEETAAEAGGDTAPKTDETAAVDETPPAKPKRTRAKKPPAAAPEFEPAPNGKRDEDVPPPIPDPLTARRDEGS